MAETLLSPSRILLYGRVIVDLKIEQPLSQEPAPGRRTARGKGPELVSPREAGLGANTFLENQLRADAGDPGREGRIARIYGFSYEGHYYDLAKPALFLVHGPGKQAEAPLPADPKAAREPSVTDKTGVAATAKSFSEDMYVWEYDKGDFSIRMDLQTGPWEQILLEAELSSDRLRTFFGGAKVRLRTPRSGDEED